MTIVLGLDLSLKAPAACMVDAAWKPGDWSKAHMTWSTRKTEHTGVERLIEIRAWLARFCSQGVNLHVPTHCYVEQYAFGASGRVAQLGEGCGVVQAMLWEKFDVRCEMVVASSARKTLLGTIHKADLGGADVKDYVSAQVAKMGAQFDTQDAIDAFVVANHGRMLLGLPHVGVGE